MTVERLTVKKLIILNHFFQQNSAGTSVEVSMIHFTRNEAVFSTTFCVKWRDFNSQIKTLIKDSMVESGHF